MSGRSVLCGLAGLALVPSTGVAALDARMDGGCVEILRDGVAVARARVDLGAGVTPDDRTSFDDSAGAKVWNRWCEREDLRYRFECAKRADGAIELTMSGEMKCNSPWRTRQLRLTVPDSILRGRTVRSLKGRASRDTGSSPVVEKGETALADGKACRWVAVDGLTFDFCPLGAANMDCEGACAVDGIWDVRRGSSGCEFTGGAVVSGTFGGWSAAKVVIREGEFKDHDRYHFRRFFHYQDGLGYSRLLSFGAPKTGRAYADGNEPYSSLWHFGWVTADSAAWRFFGGNKIVVGHPEGALYSCVTGEGKTAYRISGLEDGFYIVTVSAGNYTGLANRFDLTVDGVTLASGVSVSNRTSRLISRVFHVSNGAVEIGFDGTYIVSAIGVQPLLADGEDFSMTRGFWFSDGYEPTGIYRNRDDAERRSFAVADETIDLPVPGTEGEGIVRKPPRPRRIPQRDLPSFSWMDSPKVLPLMFNWANFAEIEDAQVFAEKFGQLADGKDVNLVMLSGLLSRHTFPAHEDRVVKTIGKCADYLHGRGVKVIDHHDITLCWNEGSGFRVLAERLPEMARTLDTGLPTFQFCISNPTHNERQRAYLRRLVEEAGVDGFQLDELCYWGNGCACRHCRRKFHEETGLVLPVNECSTDLSDRDSKIFKAWIDWRIAAVASWDVEFRRQLADVKPDLVLSEYTSPAGFLRCYPRCRASQDLIELAARAVNFIGAEVVSRNPYASHRSLIPMRRLFNALSAFSDAPVYGWYYGHDPRVFYFAWCAANMSGQSALLLDEEVPRTPDVPDYLTFGASPGNMVRKGAEPVAEVAVLFSRHSRDWNRMGDFTVEMLGLAQELESLHVPYEFITDEALTAEKLKKYRVVFLAAAECLSDAEVVALKTFAEMGGVIQMSVKSGSLDESGVVRDWPFEPLLGAVGRGRIIYDGAFGAKRRNMPELNPERPYRPQGFESGADVAAEVRGKVLDVLGTACRWKIDAPEKVYSSIWQEGDGSYVVHFLNATGAVDPLPGGDIPERAPTEAFPAVERDLVVTAPVPTLASAVASSPDFEGVRKLDVRTGPDGTSTIVLPRQWLKAYSVVRMTAGEK